MFFISDFGELHTSKLSVVSYIASISIPLKFLFPAIRIIIWFAAAFFLDVYQVNWYVVFLYLYVLDIYDYFSD